MPYFYIKEFPLSGSGPADSFSICNCHTPNVISVAHCNGGKWFVQLNWESGDSIELTPVSDYSVTVSKNPHRNVVGEFFKGNENELFKLLTGCDIGTTPPPPTAVSSSTTITPPRPDYMVADFSPVGGNGKWGSSSNFSASISTFAHGARISLSGSDFEDWLGKNLSNMATDITSKLPPATPPNPPNLFRNDWDHVGPDAIDISKPPTFSKVGVQGETIDNQEDFWEGKGTCDFASPAGTPSTGYEHFIEAKVASSNRVNITPHSNALIEAACDNRKHPWIIIAFESTTTDPTKILVIKPDTVKKIWAGTSSHARLIEKACYTLSFGGAISSPPGKRTFGLSGGIEYELVFTRPVGAPCFEYPNPGGPIKVFVR